MLGLEVCLSLSVLFVCGFFPGFFLVRHLRWSPVEKLCASIGLSLILIYLVAGVTYCISPENLRVSGLGYTVLSLALTGLSWKDTRSWARTVRVRASLIGYAFLVLWTFLLLAMIRNYSGDGWSGDWSEHFQRSLFFLHNFPLDAKMLGKYLLPARPPFMNLVCAFLMAQTDDRFEIFQADAAVLNLLAFLSCCLILPALSGKRRPFILPLTGLFAMSPAMMESATYTWTKALPAFFTITAFWFYLAGWRKKDTWRMTAAFVALAAGLLSHYSCGPYCLFFAIHYLLFVFLKRPNKVSELAAITMPAALLLSTWFAWSIAHYGGWATVASNTSVTSSQRYTGSNLEKAALNIADTLIVPYLRHPSIMNRFKQPNRLGHLRDIFFITYEGNLIFSMGIVGGPFVLWLLYRKIRLRSNRQAVFWQVAIPFCVVIGIATIGERDNLGMAHVTLLTVVLLGITLVASAFPLTGIARWLVLAGCCVDFFAGVLLNVRIENLDIRPPEEIWTTDGTLAFRQEGRELSKTGLLNWIWKNQYAHAVQVLGAVQGHDSAGFHEIEEQFQATVREVDYDYQGWYSRHGGHEEFLGDHLAGPEFTGLDIPSLCLLGLWVGIVRKMKVRGPLRSGGSISYRARDAVHGSIR